MANKNKGSKSRKTTETKVVEQKKAKIVTDQHGDDHFVVLETKDYYTFTYMLPGKLFFKREDGKEDFFDGKETKDNITTKERKMLLKSEVYTKGWIVEEKEESDEVTEEEIFNKNAISDSRLRAIVEKNKSNIVEIEEIINGMTSELALSRIKDAIIEFNCPSSLVVYCDFKLKKLEEEYIESQKAPTEEEIK